MMATPSAEEWKRIRSPQLVKSLRDFSASLFDKGIKGNTLEDVLVLSFFDEIKKEKPNIELQDILSDERMKRLNAVSARKIIDFYKIKIPTGVKGAAIALPLLGMLNEEDQAAAGAGMAMAGGIPLDIKKKMQQLKERIKEFSDYGRRGDPEDINYAKSQFDKANKELVRLLKDQRGAVRIPNWLLGGFPELQEAATGPPVEGTNFPRLTEEDVMDVVAEDARRTPRPRDLGTVSGFPLTPSEIATLKEQEQIIEDAKEIKRRGLNRERRARQEAADIEWRKRNLSAIRPELQWQVDLMTGATDDVEFPPPPPPDNVTDLRPIQGPVQPRPDFNDIARLPANQQQRAIEAAIQDMVDGGGVHQELDWLTDEPLWMKNKKIREALANQLRSEFKLLQGEGKIPKTTQLKNWLKGLGPQAKELGRANYKDIVEVEDPKTKKKSYKGFGKAGARGLFGADVALQVVDAVDRLIKGDDPVEIAKSVTTQGVYDIYQLYEKLKEDKLRGVDIDSDFMNGLLKLTTPMETRQDISERRLSDAAAAKAMAQRSGYEVTEEFGSGAVASGKLPTKTKAPVSVEFGELEELSEEVWDEDETKEALEKMGISWGEVLN